MSLETPRLQSRRKLASIRRRFEAINRQRLQRLEGMLTPRQQPLVQLLPLLFHTNHMLMPGFVAGETPKGISSYVPDKSSRQSAARLAKSFKYRHESGDLMRNKPQLWRLDVPGPEAHNLVGRFPEDARRLAAGFAARRAELEENPRGWR